MEKDFINLVKICVGAQNVSDLFHWQKNKLISSSLSKNKSAFHITRMRPKRENEILRGGSLFWVFKGLVLARQKIIGLEDLLGNDNILRCKIILEPKIILTEPAQKKPFQGWRYLKVENSPVDRGVFSNDSDLLPFKLEKKLLEIGIF